VGRRVGFPAWRTAHLRAMQGGHADGLELRWRKSSGSDATLKEVPLDVAFDQVVEISLTCKGDAVVDALRRLFVFVLATPLAWLHGEVSADDLRRRKLKKAHDGFKTVLAIQAACRHPVLDAYFGFWSFFGEEEFYLIALPILFWNVNYVYARHMNYIVCFGLVAGNTLKDVFRLPRPDPRTVWRPDALTSMDSTACRDFGFPSTHAMNAVSNTLFTLLFVYGGGAASAEAAEVGASATPWSMPPFWVLAIVVLWVFSMTFGRLYLGVHSPTDVRGGLVLGSVVAIHGWGIFTSFDRWVLTTPHIFGVLLILACVFMTLNPQPRLPLTPTFMQNCLLAGLVTGCATGFRLEVDRCMQRPEFSCAEARAAGHGDGAMAMVVRTVLGYVCVLLTRSFLKEVFVKTFRLLGMNPQPKAPQAKGADPKDAGAEVSTKSSMNDLKVLRGWDLFAAAGVKYLTYLGIAIIITHGCPAMFDFLGISKFPPLLH